MNSLQHIEKKDRKQTVKNAAIIVGVNRTSFYKDYIDTGKLSKKSDERGKPYIEIEELCRVFGLEKCLDGLQRLRNTKKHIYTVKTEQNLHTPTHQKHIESKDEILLLKVEHAKLQGEIDKLKAVLLEKEERMKEKDAFLIEKNQLLLEQKERLNSLEVRYDRLLEGQEQHKTHKSFIDKLKDLFS